MRSLFAFARFFASLIAPAMSVRAAPTVDALLTTPEAATPDSALLHFATASALCFSSLTIWQRR